MADVALLRPLWLLALPAVLLLAWHLHRRQSGLGGWETALDPAMLAAMQAMGRVVPGTGHARAWALPFAAALIVLGLAGPAVERRDTVSFRNLDGVVFVLDASAETVAGPLWPALIGAGRGAIGALGSRPAGLIVYAGDAYVATDMTADGRELGQTLSVVDGETVPDPGADPSRALDLAGRMLREAGVLAGDVVLIGASGADATAAAAATRLVGQGARVSVVAPDTPAMRAVTGAGAGLLFDPRDAPALAAFITGESRVQIVQDTYRLVFWSDLGRLVLGFALIPLFLAFRRVA